MLPRVLVVAVTVVPSPKFHVYVHVSLRFEPLLRSVLASVTVTVRPVDAGVNEATGE